MISDGYELHQVRGHTLSGPTVRWRLNLNCFTKKGVGLLFRKWFEQDPKRVLGAFLAATCDAEEVELDEIPGLSPPLAKRRTAALQNLRDHAIAQSWDTPVQYERVTEPQPRLLVLPAPSISSLSQQIWSNASSASNILSGDLSWCTVFRPMELSSSVRCCRAILASLKPGVTVASVHDALAKIPQPGRFRLIAGTGLKDGSTPTTCVWRARND